MADTGINKAEDAFNAEPEAALLILDIAENSVRAGAAHISVEIEENNREILFSVADDGCGMTTEALSRLFDPSYTTKPGHRGGLGTTRLKRYAEKTGGWVRVQSVPLSENGSAHGTVFRACLLKNDGTARLGDLPGVVMALIHGAPAVDFTVVYGGKILFFSAVLREKLCGVPLSEPEVLLWIRDAVRERLSETKISALAAVEAESAFSDDKNAEPLF